MWHPYTRLKIGAILVMVTTPTWSTRSALSRGASPLPLPLPLPPPPSPASHGHQPASLSSELIATARSLHFSAEASQHELLAFQARLNDSTPRIDLLQSLIQDDSDAPKRARVACQVAKLGLTKVIASDDSDYEFEKDANWSQTCWLPAACFIRPQNSLEVALTLKIIATLEAKFAVRSGGHNANARFSSIDQNGLLIDVRDLQLRRLNEDGSMSAGSGNRWRDIYAFLDGHGLGAVGGRHDDVGVAGFLLGGGMSFFPNRYGLGADSVENFKIVLANSTLVNANAQSNKDIFQALKGGASNFGIVTEFRIRPHPIQRIWYSLDIYNPLDYKAVLNATVQAQSEMESDPNLGLFVNVGPQSLFVGKFCAQWVPYPNAFQAFSHLTPIQTFVPQTNGTLKNLVTAINTHMGEAKEPHAVSFGVDLELYIKLHEEYLALVNSSRTSTATLTYTIQPVGKACVEYGRQHGGNSLGVKLAPQTWFAPLVEWTSQEEDTASHDLVTELGQRAEAFAKEHNAFLPYQFMNDASHVQKPLASYGSQSLSHLLAVSAAYDHSQLFQKLQDSGFLLSRT